MKKFAYIAIVALAASMAACGGNKAAEENTEAVDSAAVEVVAVEEVACACDSCACDSCTGNCATDTVVAVEVAEAAK